MRLDTCGGDIIAVPENTILHLQAHPEMEADDYALLREAAAKANLARGGRLSAGNIVTHAVEMGHPVGKTGRVDAPAIELDTVTTFAVRKGREKPSRVTEIDPANEPDCSSVVLWVLKLADGVWELETAYVGTDAPREPFDLGSSYSDIEWLESIGFWSRNALVYRPKDMGQIIHTSWQEVLGWR